ncbi:MAG: hypothetical protein QXG16_04775 [Candidatus Anstonellaceae archaeon]
MILTKKQIKTLLNGHIGNGIIAVKISDDTIKMAKFYIDKVGNVRHIKSGRLFDFNQFIDEARK